MGTCTYTLVKPCPTTNVCNVPYFNVEVKNWHKPDKSPRVSFARYVLVKIGNTRIQLGPGRGNVYISKLTEEIQKPLDGGEVRNFLMGKPHLAWALCWASSILFIDINKAWRMEKTAIKQWLFVACVIGEKQRSLNFIYIAWSVSGFGLDKMFHEAFLGKFHMHVNIFIILCYFVKYELPCVYFSGWASSTSFQSPIILTSLGWRLNKRAEACSSKQSSLGWNMTEIPECLPQSHHISTKTCKHIFRKRNLGPRDLKTRQWLCSLWFRWTKFDVFIL